MQATISASPDLHRARRAPQRDDARGAAHRHMIEPAQRQPEMLRQADRACRARA